MKRPAKRPAPEAAPSMPPNLLSGLTTDQDTLARDSADQRQFEPGRVIIRRGELATNLFLLTRGKAKYFRVTNQGEEVLLWWLAPGDAFGMGSLLSASIRYIGTAQAVDDCELLVWKRDSIQSLTAATRGVLTQNALNIVLYYLAAYADRLVGLATATAEQRLAQTLLRVARRAGNVRETGIELSMMNEDLARLANVSPFTASRQLKEWERQGIVLKNRAKVLILSPERLVID